MAKADEKTKVPRPKGQKVEPKKDGQLAEVDCKQISLPGIWAEKCASTTIGCGGAPKNEISIVEDRSGDGSFLAERTEYHPGFVFNQTKTSLSLSFDTEKCMLIETGIHAVTTVGSEVKEIKLSSAPSYSKVIAIYNAQGKQSIKVVDCTDATCANLDAAKAVEFERLPEAAGTDAADKPDGVIQTDGAAATGNGAQPDEVASAEQCGNDRTKSEFEVQN